MDGVCFIVHVSFKCIFFVFNCECLYFFLVNCGCWIFFWGFNCVVVSAECLNGGVRLRIVYV